MAYIKKTRIAKIRSCFPTGKTVKTKKVVTIDAFEREDGIAIQVSKYVGLNSSGKPTFDNIYGKLSYKNGKFNFYRYAKNKNVRIASPYEFLQIQNGRHKRVTQFSGASFYGLRKVQNKRLYKVIKDFCKKKNVDIKYLSKDPSLLMNQLCYPGTQILPDEALKHKFHKLFKKDFTKSIFGNNGSACRRLVIEKLKASNANPKILDIIRVYRILFGSDKAMALLKDINIPNRAYTQNTIAAIKKLFKYLGPNKSIKSLDYFFSDTVDIFNKLEPQYWPKFSDAKQFHDDLSRTYTKLSKEIRENTELPTPKLITELVQKWDDPDYTLVIPQKGKELIEWSSKMSNCVSSYIDRVRNKQYFIFAIAQGEVKYNVGLRGNVIDQWSGYGNTCIPEDIQERFKKQLTKVGIKV